MISTPTYVLALLFAVIVIVIGYAAVTLGEESKGYRKLAERRLAEKKSTEFLDRNKVDDTCDICFGEFENGRVAVCECGMKFHEECAEMTGECPYCKRPFSGMEIREIRRPRCPVCKNVIEKNVCQGCGTVVPNKDMRFECVCGATVFAGDGYCKECGATYEFTYKARTKGK